MTGGLAGKSKTGAFFPFLEIVSLYFIIKFSNPADRDLDTNRSCTWVGKGNIKIVRKKVQKESAEQGPDLSPVSNDLRKIWSGTPS